MRNIRKVLKRALCIMLCVIMYVGLMPVSSMKVQAAGYTLTPLPSDISNKIIKPVSGLTAEQAKEICKDSSYDVVIYKVEDNLAYHIVKLDSGWAEGRPENFGYLSTITLYNWAVIGTVENHEHVWTYETEDENTFVGYCKTPECSVYTKDNPIELRLRVPDVVLAGTNAPAYYNPSAQLTWENITGNSAPDIKYYADASLSTPVEDITAEKGGTYYAAAKIEGTEVVAKTKFTIAYVVDNLVAGEPVSGEKLSTPNINEWSGYETPDAFWENAFITNANSDLSAKCHWIYRPYGELNGKKIDDVTFNTYGKSELTIDESWSGGAIYVEMDFGNGIVLCSKPMNIKTEPFKLSWKEDSFVGKWNTYPGATQYWVVLYKNNSAIIDGYRTTRPGSVGNVKEYDFESMIKAQGTGKYKFSVSPFVSNSYKDTGMKSSEIIYCSSHTYGEYMADDEGKHYQKCTFCNRESEHEAHSGGIADCKNKAVCEVCSKEYGEVDLTKHDYSESVPNGDGTFKIVCKICGKDYEPVITVDGLLVGTGFIGNTLTTNINDDIVDEYYDDKLKPNDSSADPVQYGKFYYIPKDSDEEVLIDSSKIISDSDGVSYKLVIKEEWADGQIYVQYENIYGKKYVSKRIPIYKVRGQISVDNLEYTIDVIDDTFFATLTGPSDLSGDIVIPEKITNNGIDIPVTAIKEKLFLGNDNITSVIMPDTITEIGITAFAVCKNLKVLLLSNNLNPSTFDSNTIQGSWSLEKTNIPESFETIPNGYFAGITTIKELIIPASIKSIRKDTFSRFDSLETVIYLGTEEQWNTLINENCAEGNDVLKTAKVTCHAHVGTKVDQVDATCTSYGVKAYYKCSCGKYFTDSECKIVIADIDDWKVGDGKIDKRNHDFTNQQYHATDDKTKHYQECKDCGATSIPVAHSETEIKNKKAATCTEKGYTGDICCKDCGVIIEAGTGIDAKGHTEEVIPGKAATCTETGLTEGSHCSVCNTVIKAQDVIKAKGHSFDEGVVTKEPTYDEEGEKLCTCLVCKATEKKVIDKLVRPETPVTIGDSSYKLVQEAMDADGKPLPAVDLSKAIIVKGNKVTFAKASDMKLEGYTFKGFYANNKKVKSLKANKLKDGMVITACYVENTYTVAYKLTKPAKGVKVKGKIKSYKAKYTEEITINDGSQITAEGYKIVGWTKSKKGTEADYAAGTTTSSMTGKNKGKVTLYPIWEKIE